MSDSVAVVIVTYNSADEIGGCLDALRRWASKQVGNGAVAEIVVVDNASADSTCDIVESRGPLVKLIHNDTNRGFAAAVNQGVRATISPLVLLLNPDAVLDGPLDELVAEFAEPQTGAAGGKLIDPSGEWQRGFNVRALPTPAALISEVLLLNRLWPRNPVNRRYRMLDMNPERAQDVDQPAGAFLMFRREIWEKLGGLDEAFHPLWFEDVDFCLRIRQAGSRIRFVPGAVARHTGAHSVRSATVQFQKLAWYCSFLQFGHKHFSSRTYFGLRFATAVGLWMRWFASWYGGGDRDERRAYRSALKMVMGSQAAPRGFAQAGRAPIVES